MTNRERLSNYAIAATDPVTRDFAVAALKTGDTKAINAALAFVESRLPKTELATNAIKSELLDHAAKAKPTFVFKAKIFPTVHDDGIARMSDVDVAAGWDWELCEDNAATIVIPADNLMALQAIERHIGKITATLRGDMQAMPMQERKDMLAAAAVERAGAK